VTTNIFKVNTFSESTL